MLAVLCGATVTLQPLAAQEPLRTRAEQHVSASLQYDYADNSWFKGRVTQARGKLPATELELVVRHMRRAFLDPALPAYVVTSASSPKAVLNMKPDDVSELVSRAQFKLSTKGLLRLSSEDLLPLVRLDPLALAEVPQEDCKQWVLQGIRSSRLNQALGRIYTSQLMHPEGARLYAKALVAELYEDPAIVTTTPAQKSAAQTVRDALLLERMTPEGQASFVRLANNPTGGALGDYCVVVRHYMETLEFVEEPHRRHIIGLMLNSLQ